MTESVVGLVDHKYIKDGMLRRERMKTIAEILDVLSEALSEGLDIPQSKKAQIPELIDELKALDRIDRSEHDQLYFAYEYFSEELNPDNEGNLIPAGITYKDAPDFHHELTEIMNVLSMEELNKRVAWSAPRGHAKSAYLSNVLPIHEVVFEKRKYILVISETDSASKKFVEWIANELKHNTKLRHDFGEILSPNRGVNEKDNQESFLASTGTLVEATSIGKQLRGKRNGAHRPDLVICDDLESSKNTNTKELVDKNIDWFDKVVVPIGDPARTSFVYMGTTVIANGLLQHVQRKSDFHSKTFSAIINGPERGDLWEALETTLRDIENRNRLSDAKEMYANNTEEMDKGIEVLWAGRWTYFNLIVEKSNMTSRAFNSEFMNNPIDTENAVFRIDQLTYFDYPELHEKQRYFEFYSAWDIAMGKNNRSDYNAILTVARDKRTGVFYVVDAWAKKVPAHEALQHAVTVIEKYNPKIFAVETVGAQHDLYRQLKELAMKRGIYGTKIQPIMSRGKKEERVEMLEPLVENGALRFMRHQRLLLEQMEQFPMGANDDLPDALQMAVEIGTKMKRRTYHKKPKGI